MSVITKDSTRKHRGQSSRRSALSDKLLSVVSRVRLVLRQGKSVFTRDVAGAYEFQVTGIRFLRDVQLLQVQASFGWTTIWDTERLIDQCGDCLFECPTPDDTVEFLRISASRIGLMPSWFRDDARITTGSL